MLFCFVLVWTGLMALQDLNVLGRADVLRFATRCVLVAVLSLFAGFFSETGSVDHENYLNMFDEVPPETALEMIALKDPLFQLMGFFLRNSDGNLAWLMFFSTFISLGIKVRILSSRHYNNIAGLAVIFLVARFFLLHEFTQIRASLGIAFLSLSIIYAMEKKLVLVLTTLVIAALTHLSTLALLPMVVLVYRVDVKVKAYIFIIMALVIFLASLIFDAERLSRLAPYLTGEYQVTENTLLSTYFLFKLIILIGLFLRWKSLTTALQGALLTSTYGIFLTWIFLQNDVLSLRLGELTAVFDCVCIAYFFRHGFKSGLFFGYLAGVIVAAVFYFSSTNIVNPLSLRF